MKRLLAVMVSLSISLACAQTYPTQVDNTGYLDVYDSNGALQNTQPSNTVTVTVQPVAGLTITPDNNPANPSTCGQIVPIGAGTQAALTYQVRNTGNLTDTFTLQAQPSSAPYYPADPQQYSGVTAVTFALESNGQAGYQTGDTLLGTTTASLTLLSQASATVYALYTAPAGAAGGTYYGTTLVGTTGNGAVTDGNNLGCFVVARAYNLDMTQAPAQVSATPDTRVFTHVLTNTGNTPILSSQFMMDRPATPQDAMPASFQATLGGYTGTSADPAEAVRDLLRQLEAAGSTWQPGQQITFTDTVQVPAAVPNGTVNIVNTRPWINVTATATTVNALPQASASDHPDQLTVQVAPPAAGTPLAYKSQQDCGTLSASACVTPVSGMVNNPAFTQPLSVRPCDYIKYALSGVNSGPGLLYAPILRDTVPQNMTGLWLQELPGDGLIRVNGGAWMSTSAVLAAQPFMPQGTLIEVGRDTNGDGQVNGNDPWNAGDTISFALFTKVNSSSCP